MMGTRRALAGALVPPARAYVRHGPGRVGKRVLAQRLLEPALRSRPRSFRTTTVDGTTLQGQTGDMIQRYLYVFGVWEPELTHWMRRRLAPGRTLVDVGANVGYFSLLGSSLVGHDGHVVAVEALPATFAQLQANLQLNGTANVRALNVAAAARPGRVRLFGGQGHNSGTTSMRAGDGLEPLGDVEAVRLADALTRQEIRTARVVKIDVEGAELAVLQGLEPVLAEAPEDLELVVEITPDPAAARGRAAPVELLAAHGFHPYRLVNDYRLSHYVRRPPPAAPRRLTGPLTSTTDVVFSRVDATELA